MAEKQTNEALEKLNQGIQESKEMAQQQTMQLAQDFFGDSVEMLKRQIEQSRTTLENLPEQVPGGQDEAFQILFQELMSNYEAIEEILDEAKSNVANLDTEQLKKEGDVDASEAARREARSLGVDLTEVEGTGADGRIIVSDVIEAVAQAGDGSREGPKASRMVRRKAEELGIDLSEIQGSGPGGIITIGDVTEFGGEAGGQAADRAGQAAESGGDAVGQAVRGTTDTAEQATEQVDATVGQVTNGAKSAAGQGAREANSAVGQASGQVEQPAGEDGTGEDFKVTNAARIKAEELGVDLSSIRGTGAGGLITLKDVLQA